MAPKGRGRKRAEVVENKSKVNDRVEEVNAELIGRTVKAPQKAASKGLQSNNVENELNGSEEQENANTEDDQVKMNSLSTVPTDENVLLKKLQKTVKAKTGKEPVKNEEVDGSSKLKEEDKPKKLPAKRGRKAIKIENGVDLTTNKDLHDIKSGALVEDLPRTRGKAKRDVEPSNSIKEQDKPEPKETKVKSNKKVKVQPEEDLAEKEAPSKGSKNKIKAVVEKKLPKATNKVEDGNLIIDENCQLRVSLQRKKSLDEMAMQLIEHHTEITKESKVKNVKGGAKGKGKRAAKDAPEDSQPTKKTKDDTSKSKGAAKKEKEKIPDVTALDFANESKSADGKPWNFKISTWNVNGLRAWLEKNGLSFLHHEKPDIMCVQETKCSEDKLPPEVNNIDGYHSYWLAGDKDGYSGVGLLSKEKPLSVQYGIGMEKHDHEGRVITAEYEEFYLVTTYIPNAGRGLIRLDYRQEWDKDFQTFIKKLDMKKPVVLCGDLNVAHEEIDLANPKTNKKSAGFTKEEREGFSVLLSEGFLDTYRHLYPDQTGSYTFWTYMMNARAKNVGWRLDYFVISKRFADHLCDSIIRKDVYGSDHCPITLFLHV